ncbi:MAG: site-2 protease family protein [Candidatus Micrarchaeota archaeon]|nr:site-2 protease family protein [Candidatus Micrarchaeota archaeon]
MVELSPYVGRIAGIRIQLHWSFILLLVGIFLLTSIYLFTVWVLLFLCVLVHELAHSLLAKRNNIPVKKIILYPFGGGSIIDFERVKPSMEYNISIIGPVSSLVLAAIFGAASLYAPTGTIQSTLQLLFALNVFLGVFNILPWFPLDGGRALRSYLQKSRSFFDATKLAVNVSKIVTILFIIGTIVYVALIPGSFAYKEFIVLFDIIIGMFIYDGARAELRLAYVKTNITALKAKDAMSRNFTVVKPTAHIHSIYEAMLKHDANIILFKEGGEVKTVSHKKVQSLAMNPAKRNDSVARFGMAISQVEPNDPLFTGIERMNTNDTSIAAVLSKGRPVGVLLMPHIESVVALYLSKRRHRNLTS